MTNPASGVVTEHTDALLEALCGVEPDEAKRLRQEESSSTASISPPG